MAAFQFRLERVLDVREILEEKAKHQWAAEERLVHVERIKLAKLKQQEQDTKTFGYQQSEIQLRQAMYSFLDRLQQEIEQQAKTLQQQEQLAYEAKQDWLRTRQETKKVTKLREKQYAAHVKEEQRKEQNVLDDMRWHVET